MRDLLIALLLKNPYIINKMQCLPPFHRQPLLLQQNLDPTSIFQNLNPPMGEGSHYGPP